MPEVKGNLFPHDITSEQDGSPFLHRRWSHHFLPFRNNPTSIKIHGVLFQKTILESLKNSSVHMELTNNMDK